MKQSNPCSQKNDESIPVIDISKISGDVSHAPVELIEDEAEYKGIHHFFEEDQEEQEEGQVQEEEKQWETEQEETMTQGQEEYKVSEVREVREPSMYDEGIQLQPVVMEAPTPLSTKNPTPIQMSGAPKVLSQNLSGEAKDFVRQFEEAIQQGDGQLLSDLVYDADMEGDLQLDLQWYENKAAQLLQN